MDDLSRTVNEYVTRFAVNFSPQKDGKRGMYLKKNNDKEPLTFLLVLFAEVFDAFVVTCNGHYLKEMFSLDV